MKKKLFGLLVGILMLAGSFTAYSQLVNVKRLHDNQWFLDDVQLQFGSYPDVACEYDTNQTNDALVCGLSTDSERFILTQKADMGTNFGLSDLGSPAISIISASAAHNITMYHDGTNGVIDVDSGVVSFPDGIAAPIAPTGMMTFSAGAAVTGTAWQIGRDADGTNQLHFNSPTGSTMEWSINDVAEMLLSATALDVNNDFDLNSASAGVLGSTLTFEHNSASPAALDEIGVVTFAGNDDGTNATDYIKISGVITDPTDSTEAAVLQTYLTDGGAYPTLPNSQLSETAFNAVRTDDGATGMTLQMTHASASPAASDEVGLVKFVGYDDATHTQEYAQISGSIVDPADGTESGAMNLKAANASGVVTTAAVVSHDGTNGILSVGDGAASGILESNGSFNLTLQTGNATTGSITIVDGADADITLAPNGTGTVSINDSNISNVGDIALDTISTDNTNGLITMAGVGGALNNEDLIFDFETTADEVAISSSTGVATIDIGAINFIGGRASLGSVETGNLYSATAGSTITMAGLGGALNDEDLVFDFETVANQVGVSSSSGVTDIEFGTIELNTQELKADDVTLETEATGGNAGARNHFVGVPKIKMLGLGAGSDGSTETVQLTDDTPDGECAGVNQTAADDAVNYRVGSNSLQVTFAATPLAADGTDCTIAGDDYSSNESIGFWFRTDTALSAGDVYVELDDDDAAPDFTVDLPAVSTINQWTWIELDISGCDGGGNDCNVVDGIKFLIDAGGATTLAAGGNIWIDFPVKWDADNETTFGEALLQDGVMSVLAVATAAGSANTQANVAEYTDYFVNYTSGNEDIVYMSNQSANSLTALVALE